MTESEYIPPTVTKFHFTRRSLAPGERRQTQRERGLDGHKALGYRGFEMKECARSEYNSPS